MQFSPRFRFSDWPNPEVPAVAAGVYAIWEDQFLVYCGMSGTKIETDRAKGKRKAGLVIRLASHASGRLSGDQFCVYVANRLVIPKLQPTDLNEFAAGTMTLDRLTKQFIHAHLEYQFVEVQSSEEAFRLEKLGRSGELFETKPLLNPIA